MFWLLGLINPTETFMREFWIQVLLLQFQSSIFIVLFFFHFAKKLEQNHISYVGFLISNFLLMQCKINSEIKKDNENYLFSQLKSMQSAKLPRYVNHLPFYNEPET